MTRSTQANHCTARSPRPQPEGPAGDNFIAGPRTGTTRGSPPPLPRQRPQAGTKSPVLGRPPRAPRSRPANPGAQAPGVRKGNMASGQPTGAPTATGLDEARRTSAEPRGTPERHAAGHNQGTRTGAKQQRPLGAANPSTTHNPQRTTAQEQVPGETQPTHRTLQPGVAGDKPSACTTTHTHTHRNTRARSGGAQPRPDRNTHTHTAHPSQEWWGTSGAPTQTHTHPNTAGRSGGAQTKPEPKHTHAHRTTLPAVAGYKRSAHKNTHTSEQPSRQ